jgi:hypothetical protein
MKLLKAALALTALLALSGCVAVPVDPYYGHGYPAGYYAPYYGPSIGLSIQSSRSYGSGFHGGHRHGSRSFRGWHRR